MKTNFKIGKFINEYRAYLLVLIIFLLGTQARNFFTIFNFASIFNGTVLVGMLGVAFTICMIAGHLDLSVSATAAMGGVLAMGMHTFSGLSWGQAIVISVAMGTGVGIINGLLITKANIHSFITTLGMQFVLRGAMFIYSGGGEIGAAGNFAFASFLTRRIGSTFITPKVAVVLVCIIILAILLAKTQWGRNIYMIGGNSETAWLAGIKRDFTVISVFAISGFFSALGGAIFAIAQGSAQSDMGDRGIPPLMVALAATIIGGTATTGGKGSVWKTFVAIFGLMAMFNVLTSIFGMFEIQILANGLVLAACVFHETITTYFSKKKIGIRADLGKERARELGAKN